ncbi:MAG TPA: hypothetical protein VHM31_01985 [Polyangia bacterium]|nr:hypothetical protein [Polyangia bacterium]
MTGARPRRLALSLTVAALLSIAAAGVVVGPNLAPSLTARNGALAKVKRKFEALRRFALFRAPGDRAVLRGGDPAPAKHVAPKH